MIYKGIDIELKAFQWGVDEAPDWILAVKTRQISISNEFSSSDPTITTGGPFSGRRLVIAQPEGNKDLACGEETACLCDFIVLTKGGSFQVYKPEHFYRIFISRTKE
jgi:hypothetical protein